MEFLMECLNTIKNLKINKEKVIGTVIIIVEGESDEFDLLKHIFTEVFDYNYISMKRNKLMKHEFVSKDNKNTIIVCNTKSSTINTLIDDVDYRDKIYNILKKEFKRTLKNTPIYILWDRDNKTNSKKNITDALNIFTNAMDNDYEMNGILLLSYPCLECYEISNFSKKLWKNKYSLSEEVKKDFHMLRNNIHDINENTLLLAVENMHRTMLSYDIRNYDVSDFKRVNKRIYRKEEESYKNSKFYNALSLVSIMLIDLGIIEEK